MPVATPLSLKVVNPGMRVPPGIQLPCYGPYYMPAGAKSLRKFMPQVNMDIVHHMIMFGGKGGRQNEPVGNTHRCYQGSIMFAWARTGQITPIGLDFADSQLEGDGFAVGPGTKFPNQAATINLGGLANGMSGGIETESWGAADKLEFVNVNMNK